MGKSLEWLCQASLIETDDCIPWPYSKAKGYGQLRFEGKIVRAHKLMLELFGPEPESDEHTDAAHLPVVCHNRACVNLRHLYWATREQNLADRVKDGVHVGPPFRLKRLG